MADTQELPSAVRYGSSGSPAYLAEIGRFIRDTRFEDLPSPVVDCCKRLIADCFAIITAGNQSAELRRLASSRLRNAPPGASWVIGTPHRTAACNAAFLNGMASTWHDFDAGNTIAYSHPGSQAIPAAVAMAQELGVSGRDLLLAAVLGYEVSGRVGMASKMRVSVHPHGTCGVIGSAVAAARMKGLDEARLRHVVNVAATMAMATNRQAMLDEATVRNVYSGHSALAGLMAVQLVEAGVTGQRDGIGFTYGTVIADGFDPQRMVAGLGKEWLITQGYFKLHPSGRYSHAAIDALQAALATLPEGRLEVARIRRIEVKAFQMAALLAGKNITTSFGAKFSIPFALATILVHGRSGIDCFDMKAVENPLVQALVARIDVSEDPDHTRAYPARQRCDVLIHLEGGGTVRGHCEIMKGEPANPHRREEVEKKFYDLTVPVWGAERADALYSALLKLEDTPDLRAFGSGFAL
jgi:2-methylcitrate dehydratase PrpD